MEVSETVLTPPMALASALLFILSMAAHVALRARAAAWALIRETR